MKLQLMWNILRGRPVMYRIRITDGIVRVGLNDRALIVECRFDQTRKRMFRCDFQDRLARWLPGILAKPLARWWPERLLPKRRDR